MIETARFKRLFNAKAGLTTGDRASARVRPVPVVFFGILTTVNDGGIYERSELLSETVTSGRGDLRHDCRDHLLLRINKKTGTCRTIPPGDTFSDGIAKERRIYSDTKPEAPSVSILSFEQRKRSLRNSI